MPRNRLLAFALGAAMALPMAAHAGDNLKLNQHLDYATDSQDGPLISGNDMDRGLVDGKPNHIIFYGEG